MIRSFRCRDTRELFETGSSARFAGIAAVAQRKLAMLHAAATLTFLAAPPGNRLELLRGDRAGRYSIRVNGRYRLCFRWTPDGVEDVEMVDYH